MAGTQSREGPENKLEWWNVVLYLPEDLAPPGDRLPHHPQSLFITEKEKMLTSTQKFPHLELCSRERGQEQLPPQIGRQTSVRTPPASASLPVK